MKNWIKYWASGALIGLFVFPLQPGFAQTGIEVGGLGLITFYRSVDVSNASTTGSIGPQWGPAGGFVLGQTMSNRWGGEIRYLYFRNDLELTAGSQSTDFGAQSHAVHYDVLYYFSDVDTHIRPYVAVGGGLKYYQGTGTEDPFQPLSSNLAILTKTGQAKPVGDFGAGIKIRMGRRTSFRIEFRDYISGVPEEVMTAAPGAEIDGILHHWVPLFGFSWTF